MIIRAILPEWAKQLNPELKRVKEGDYNKEYIEELNSLNYNIYFLPNYPSLYDPSKPVDGSCIDKFDYVFIDMDLKDQVYSSKDEFINLIKSWSLPPSRIVDSGNGVHVYWKVIDLDANTMMRIQKRLIRKFKTDESVFTIYQLMRLPGTVNTKNSEHLKFCDELFLDESIVYTSEQFDNNLPPISGDDENDCKEHWDQTFNPTDYSKLVIDNIPVKFLKLVESSKEVKDIWAGNNEDRSIADFRLGHIMFASGFTKEEAASVLVNTAKALERAPKHRINYAMNITDKIWTYELSQDKSSLNLSESVKNILSRTTGRIEGKKFPCWSYLDGTTHGFRLGDVLGFVAGSGVGKTAVCLNMFAGFVENNPDYDHFFVSLELPAHQIATRWAKLCGSKTHLHSKVHIIENYNEDGSYRNLSLEEIKKYILKYQETTGKKIGCVVIDHIGVLKEQDLNGQRTDIIGVCNEMKAFAIHTNTMLIMQSQTSREKAGDGDLELNKDAAYGTTKFESFCDYLVTMWQPIKKCYSEPGCPTVTALKFCKIREKDVTKDRIFEDTPYLLKFDPNTGFLSPITQDENNKLKFWIIKATNLRKRDRKTDILHYKSTPE